MTVAASWKARKDPPGSSVSGRPVSGRAWPPGGKGGGRRPAAAFGACRAKAARSWPSRTPVARIATATRKAGVHPAGERGARAPASDCLVTPAAESFTPSARVPNGATWPRATADRGAAGAARAPRPADGRGRRVRGRQRRRHLADLARHPVAHPWPRRQDRHHLDAGPLRPSSAPPPSRRSRPGRSPTESAPAARRSSPPPGCLSAALAPASPPPAPALCRWGCSSSPPGWRWDASRPPSAPPSRRWRLPRSRFANPGILTTPRSRGLPRRGLLRRLPSGQVQRAWPDRSSRSAAHGPVVLH